MNSLKLFIKSLVLIGRMSSSSFYSKFKQNQLCIFSNFICKTEIEWPRRDETKASRPLLVNRFLFSGHFVEMRNRKAREVYLQTVFVFNIKQWYFKGKCKNLVKSSRVQRNTSVNGIVSRYELWCNAGKLTKKNCIRTLQEKPEVFQRATQKEKGNLVEGGERNLRMISKHFNLQLEYFPFFRVCWLRITHSRRV